MFDFIERLQTLKKDIFELNPFTYLIYKYNDFIIWWDRKCHIILCKYKSGFVKAKLLTLYKKHKNYYNYLRIKKKTHIWKFKRSKVYAYDKKRNFFEWYKKKPYKKYPKYIFNYNEDKLIISFNRGSKLLLASKSVDKWYQQKYVKDILYWLGILKRKSDFNIFIMPKEHNMIHFLEEKSGRIYYTKNNQSKEWYWMRYFRYFKRANIYDYLLLKHNDSDWFKYIKWMSAKYKKVSEWSVRMYKDFYRVQNNNKKHYNSFIEQYNSNKNKNEIAHDKSVKEANLLKLLLQYNRNNAIRDYNLDVVKWLYFGKDWNLIEYLADIEYYGNKMKLQQYQQYKPNFDTKPYFNKFICLEEYNRIENDFENFNHWYYENFMHQRKIVEIIIENNVIWNVFFDNEDVLAAAYNHQKNILIEKYLSAWYEVFENLDERVEWGELYELEEAHDELLFWLDFYNEWEAQMEHDMEQHIRHRELMLSRQGITLDNIFDVLLTDEVRQQDPATYYYLVESLKFDDEYQNEIRLDIVLQRFLTKSYLLAEKKKDNIKILGKYNFEILLSLLEFENGLKETSESVDSEMQQKMLHFNEIYENIIENKTKIDTEIDWEEELANRYTEIETYLINKDWDSYTYKRNKEEMFSFKDFKKDKK